MTEYLVRYAQCDVRCAQLFVERTQLEKKRTELEQIVQEKLHELNTIREQIRHILLIVRERERECNQLQLVCNRARAAQAGAVSVTVYEHAEKELAHNSQALAVCEEQLIIAWENHARLKAHNAYITQEYTLIEQQFRAQSVEWEDIIARYTIEHKKYSSEREDIYAQFPEQLRIVCAELEARFKNPIVFIHSSSCTGCFAQLRPQDEHLLERGHWIRCHECTRILLYTRGESL